MAPLKWSRTRLLKAAEIECLRTGAQEANVRRIWKHLSRNEAGATALEYALIAGIVSIGIVGASQGIAGSFVDMLGSVTPNISLSE